MLRTSPVPQERGNMEKIIEGKEYSIYRFQCDCLLPNHAIDIEVHKHPDDIIFTFYSLGATLKERIRWCWKMIRTGKGFEHDFMIREEDIEKLRKVLGKRMKVGLANDI